MTPASCTACCRPDAVEPVFPSAPHAVGGPTVPIALSLAPVWDPDACVLVRRRQGILQTMLVTLTNQGVMSVWTLHSAFSRYYMYSIGVRLPPTRLVLQRVAQPCGFQDGKMVSRTRKYWSLRSIPVRPVTPEPERSITAAEVLQCSASQRRAQQLSPQ